jgi:hypothetical protein
MRSTINSGVDELPLFLSRVLLFLFMLLLLLLFFFFLLLLLLILFLFVLLLLLVLVSSLHVRRRSRSAVNCPPFCSVYASAVYPACTRTFCKVGYECRQRS